MKKGLVLLITVLQSLTALGVEIDPGNSYRQNNVYRRFDQHGQPEQGTNKIFGATGWLPEIQQDYYRPPSTVDVFARQRPRQYSSTLSSLDWTPIVTKLKKLHDVTAVVGPLQRPIARQPDIVMYVTPPSPPTPTANDSNQRQIYNKNFDGEFVDSHRDHNLQYVNANVQPAIEGINKHHNIIHNTNANGVINDHRQNLNLIFNDTNSKTHYRDNSYNNSMVKENIKRDQIVYTSVINEKNNEQSQNYNPNLENEFHYDNNQHVNEVLEVHGTNNRLQIVNTNSNDDKIYKENQHLNSNFNSATANDKIHDTERYVNTDVVADEKNKQFQMSYNESVFDEKNKPSRIRVNPNLNNDKNNFRHHVRNRHVNAVIEEKEKYSQNIDENFNDQTRKEIQKLNFDGSPQSSITFTNNVHHNNQYFGKGVVDNNNDNHDDTEINHKATAFDSKRVDSRRPNYGDVENESNVKKRLNAATKDSTDVPELSRPAVTPRQRRRKVQQSSPTPPLSVSSVRLTARRPTDVNEKDDFGGRPPPVDGRNGYEERNNHDNVDGEQHRRFTTFHDKSTVMAAKRQTPAADDDDATEVELRRGYGFGYTVLDEYAGTDFGQWERREPGVTGAVTGQYRVKLPDGRTQTVMYTADADSGYRASVTYEGVQHHPVPVARFDSVADATSSD